MKVGDKVRVDNPGSVYHGHEGVVKRLHEKSLTHVWVDLPNTHFTMTFNVNELEVID